MDYQWTFTLWKNKQLSILPNVNLISNIGFGADATHTKTIVEWANMKHYEIILSQHPREVKRDIEADEYTSRKKFYWPSIYKRLLNKVRRIFVKLQNILTVINS